MTNGIKMNEAPPSFPIYNSNGDFSQETTSALSAIYRKYSDDRNELSYEAQTKLILESGLIPMT